MKEKSKQFNKSRKFLIILLRDICWLPLEDFKVNFYILTILPLILDFIDSFLFLLHRKLRAHLTFSKYSSHWDIYLTTLVKSGWLIARKLFFFILLTACCWFFGFFIKSGTLKFVTASTICANNNPSRASLDKSRTFRLQFDRSR